MMSILKIADITYYVTISMTSLKVAEIIIIHIVDDVIVSPTAELVPVLVIPTAE